VNRILGANVHTSLVVSLVSGLLLVSLGALSLQPRINSPMLSRVQSGSVLSSTEPVTTAQDAISRTLSILPDGHSYTGWIARNVDRARLSTEWYHETWAGSADWMPSESMWLVGVLGSGLVLSDTIHMNGVHINNAEPVEGAFCIWGQSSGILISSGALKTGTPFTYMQLQSIP